MHKLLFVIDVQNDFITGSLGTKEAENALPKIIEKVQNWDGAIVSTKDEHDENYLNTFEGKRLPIKHCILNTTGYDMPKALESEIRKKTNIIYPKEYFSDYHVMDFLKKYRVQMYENRLRASLLRPKFSEIHLIGLCTDICVISNAILAKAYFPDIPIIVDASCCAGSTPENHKAALQVMKCCQIDVINEEE